MSSRVPIWPYFIASMIVVAAGAIYMAMPDRKSTEMDPSEIATASQVQDAIANLTDGDACSRIIKEANLRALEKGIVILKKDLTDLPAALAQCRTASRRQANG